METGIRKLKREERLDAMWFYSDHDQIEQVTAVSTSGKHRVNP